MTRCQALLFALCSLAAACGTTSDAAPTAPAAPAAAPQTANTATLHEQCVATLTRSRACTDQYVPALVDARARLDRPSGIAAAVRSDRDAVIAQARSEWAKDATDAAIAERCQAIVAHLTPETQTDAGDAQRCVTQADCGAFVACVMPIIERHLAN
jgi:hypothetical protein